MQGESDPVDEGYGGQQAPSDNSSVHSHNRYIVTQQIYSFLCTHTNNRHYVNICLVNIRRYYLGIVALLPILNPHTKLYAQNVS